MQKFAKLLRNCDGIWVQLIRWEENGGSFSHRFSAAIGSAFISLKFWHLTSDGIADEFSCHHRECNHFFTTAQAHTRHEIFVTGVCFVLPTMHDAYHKTLKIWNFNDHLFLLQQQISCGSCKRGNVPVSRIDMCGGELRNSHRVLINNLLLSKLSKIHSICT